MKQNFRKNKDLCLSIIILIFGLIFTYNYWWNGKVDPTFINLLVSFFSYGTAGLFMANFITKKFIMPKHSYNFSIFNTDEQKLKKIIEEIGEEKYKNIRQISGFIFIGITIIFVVINYSFLNYYAEYQLKNYGVIKDIKINNQTKSLKGFDITTLKYENVEKEFYLDDYKVGEIRNIIYSKKKPEISEWYEK